MASASTGQSKCDIRADNLFVGLPTIVNSASHSNLHFDWPIAKEAKLESCQKDIKKLLQTNQKFCLVATARRAALYNCWLREIENSKEHFLCSRSVMGAIGFIKP